MLFYKTAMIELDFSRAMVAFEALALGSIGSLLVGGLIGRVMKLNRMTLTSLMQAGFRGNLAFVGLPIALMYLGSIGESSAKLESQIYLILAPGIILYNLVGVILIQKGVSSEKGTVNLSLLKEIGKNPLILSVVAGLSFGAVGFELGTVFTRTLSTLSGAVLPLALIGVGASIELRRVQDFGVTALVAAVIKVAVNPALGWLAAWVLGLSAQEAKILVILMITVIV